MNICVTRQPGCCQDTLTDAMKELCKFAPPVANPLIGSADAAIQVGRQIIDRQFTNRQIISGNIATHDYMEPGQLIRVDETDRDSWIGMLDTYSISIRMSGKQLTAGSAVKIEKNETGACGIDQ